MENVAQAPQNYTLPHPRKYTLDNVKNLTEYFALHCSSTLMEYLDYVDFFQQFFTDGIVSGKLENNELDHVDPHLCIPDGIDGISYPKPDIHTFTLHKRFGYLYDSATGLFYDHVAKLYFNSEIQKFLYWDDSRMTYLLAPDDMINQCTFLHKLGNQNRNVRNRTKRAAKVKKCCLECCADVKYIKGFKVNKKAPSKAGKKSTLSSSVPKTSKISKKTSKTEKVKLREKVKIPSSTVTTSNSGERKKTDKKLRAVIVAIKPSAEYFKKKTQNITSKKNPTLIVSKKNGKDLKFFIQYVRVASKKKTPTQVEVPKTTKIFNKKSEVDFGKNYCNVCKWSFHSTAILKQHVELSLFHKQYLEKNPESFVPIKAPLRRGRPTKPEKEVTLGIEPKPCTSTTVSNTEESPKTIQQDQKYLMMMSTKKVALKNRPLTRDEAGRRRHKVASDIEPKPTVSNLQVSPKTIKQDQKYMEKNGKKVASKNGSLSRNEVGKPINRVTIDIEPKPCTSKSLTITAISNPQVFPKTIERDQMYTEKNVKMVASKKGSLQAGKRRVSLDIKPRPGTSKSMSTTPVSNPQGSSKTILQDQKY